MIPIPYPKIHRLFGIELEFFLLDNEGNICNDSDKIIGSLKDELLDTEIKKECAKSMIELTSFPHLSSKHVFSDFFSDFETLLYKVDKEDMNLFYYGTYPGKNNTEMRKDKRYIAKQKILGNENWQNAGRCIGFHYHHSLPRKSYNPLIKFFYPDINDKNKKKVLNVYNLFIALDPAITALMQSSPYFEGKLCGKDSRIKAYRADPAFSFPDSLYSEHPEYGRLNNYSPDFKELVHNVHLKYKKWNLLLKEQGISYKSFTKYDYSMFDSTWQPVKISAHATMESRGSDMNSPMKVVALSTLLKTITSYVKKNNISVHPCKEGNSEPFKIEKESMLVPEHWYLKSGLQKNSAQTGLKNRSVANYCKELLKLAKKIGYEEPRNVFSDMVDEKKSTSDKIIDFVRKKQGSINSINDQTARELGLKCTVDIFKELLITKKMCEKINY